MYIILVICGWVPNRRCETGFFFYYYYFPFGYFFMAHTVSPPHFCAIYLLLKCRPSTFFVANDGSTDSCTVNIINCHDAEVCLGKINKSAGTDRKMNKYGRLV